MKSKIADKSRLSLERTVEERFLKGETASLECPPSHYLECAGNGEDLPIEDVNARGFAFSWGQLIELERDEVVTWEIRFEKLHRDFLDLERTSRELSDLFLDSLDGLQIPQFLIFKKGSLKSSSAAIILVDPGKERAARKFLINEFLRGNGSPMNTLVRSLRRFSKSGTIK